MTRFLFAAHDTGGALMLVAADGAVRARGHQISYAGTGPALEAWRSAGHEVAEVGDPGKLPVDGVDVVATGTGFTAYERDIWPLAQARGVPSVAVVDAWTSLSRRFDTGNGFAQPAVAAVLDEGVRDALAGNDWWRAELFVVGQPHLQVQTARLAERRRAAMASEASPPLVFFSEPVREDFGTTRGFNQFEVFDRLITELPADMTMLVKPHPREDASAWHDRESDRARLTDEQAPDLLIRAGGVIGMTTMVLVEAHLLGLPALSLQPGRSYIANQLIDEMCVPVLDWSTFAEAWAPFRKQFGSDQPVTARFGALLERADGRLAEALEAAAEIPAGD